MKLGLRPSPPDSRDLRFGAYIDPGRLPDPPDEVDWTKGVERWPMHRNDSVGCCTCASAAHLIRAWTTAASGSAADVTDDDVIRAYSAVSGYDPETKLNDDGAVMRDVLRRWRSTGIGGHKIEAFVRVRLDDAGYEIRQACWLFGGLYLGSDLPRAVLEQDDLWWRDPNGDAALFKRGGLGGHATAVVAYTPVGLLVVSWGRLRLITWNWLRVYGMECWAALSPDWHARGKAPSGFALEDLLADLRRIR